MALRNIFLASLTLFASQSVLASASQQPIMAASNTPSTSDLSVHLEPALEASTLKVTIRNSNPSTPLTFLQWDSPLDSSARNTGVYHIKSLASGEELESPGLMLKRKMPPAREKLVEVPAGGRIADDFKLESKWIPTDGGKYEVWVEGTWRAVFPKKKEDVTDEELNSLRGEGILNDGEFKSEKCEVVLG